MKRTRQDYGPSLTPKLKQDLEKEIAEFNLKQIKREIEDNAIGKPDIELELHNSDVRSNPDVLSEEDVPVWGGSKEDIDVENAKREIIQILTFRQYQVWDLVMRKGLSITKASERLNIDHKTLSKHLEKAKYKVREYYAQRRPH